MKASDLERLGEPGDGHLGLGDAAVAAGSGLGGDRLRRPPPGPAPAAARARRPVRLRAAGPQAAARRGAGWTTTSPWLSVAWTSFSDAPSPTAKVAAAAPNAIAATIVADRSGTGERVSQAEGHRPWQREPRGQPGRPLTAAGPRGAPDGEHVDGAQPSGPGRRRPGGRGDQRQRAGEHQRRRPTA